MFTGLLRYLNIRIIFFRKSSNFSASLAFGKLNLEEKILLKKLKKYAVENTLNNLTKYKVAIIIKKILILVIKR